MKLLLLFLLLLLPAIATAATTPPELVTPGKVIAQPSLKAPLGKEWLIPRGKWTPVNGVLTANQIPVQKHPAVLDLATGPGPMIVECDFQVDAKQTFIVGCNSKKGHVGRVTITATKVCVAENTPVNGKATNHVLTQQVISLKPGEWQHLKVEYAGDKMAAWLNQTYLDGEHPFLSTPKATWFFAATDGVKVRKIRLTQGVSPTAVTAQ
jgi:hypothetical protein